MVLAIYSFAERNRDMATRFTPGPWHWDGNTLMPVTPNPNGSAVHSILERDGGYGYLGSDHKATTAELEADYALIAAAPDLLQALRVMLGAAMNDITPECDQAREAIAKATGVTP